MAYQSAVEEGFVGKAEKVTDKAMLAGLLRRVLEGRILLSVSIPGYKESYNSAILQINEEQGFVVLDEINPREGHNRFVEQGKLRVRARLQGVDISFAGILQEAGTTEGIAFYKIALPSFLYYGQRREYYRAQIGAGMAVPVHLHVDGMDHVVDGLVRDISVGGIGAQLKFDLPLDLHQGEVLPNCTIELPTGPKIFTALEVRFIAADDDHVRLRLGGRFVDLDREQQKVVSQFVAYLDRHLRQKMTRFK